MRRPTTLIQYNLTVGGIVKKFLDHHQAVSSPATCRWYSKSLQALVTRLGSLQVTDLKAYCITEWIEKGTAPSNIIRSVKACFHWAEEQEYIVQSPLRHLKVPTATSRGDWAYLTPEQWVTLNNLLSIDLVDLVTTMKETGCRPQEVRSVEARHFDRAGRCWVFPRPEAKGKRELRIVHLSESVYEICQRLALKYPEGSLFRNSKGRGWSSAALNDRFRRLSKRLSFHVTPYSLRHTFATDAIIRGVDLQTIATLMGHSDLKMLSKVYQHVRMRSDHIKEGLRRAIA